MSLWTNLLPAALGRSRAEAPVSRAFLDRDTGPLLPTDYPYPPGTRPIRPFLVREVTNLGTSRRSDAQLFPPTGLLGRTLAHLTFRGQPSFAKGAIQDASGERVPPRGYRVRPWLYGGDTTGAGAGGRPTPPGMTIAPSGPCEGC